MEQFGNCGVVQPSECNNMRETLENVAAHLSDLGIELQCKLNPKTTTHFIGTVEKRVGFALPESYVEFVTTFANGLELFWQSSDDDGRFGRFEMSTLKSSVEATIGMRDWRFFDDDAADEYGFPYVDDSELAVITNRLMRNWIPIHSEGNGDHVSINLNPDGFGCVIFDQHDWLDGGTGQNGFVMSKDLPSFFASWGKLCFCQPSSFCWKSVIGENGVDWTSDEFDIRFRVPK